MTLKNKHKQNKQKNQNKNDPINLGYSNGETEKKHLLKESFKMPQGEISLGAAITCDYRPRQPHLSYFPRGS